VVLFRGRSTSSGALLLPDSGKPSLLAFREISLPFRPAVKPFFPSSSHALWRSHSEPSRFLTADYLCSKFSSKGFFILGSILPCLENGIDCSSPPPLLFLLLAEYGIPGVMAGFRFGFRLMPFLSSPLFLPVAGRALRPSGSRVFSPSFH